MIRKKRRGLLGQFCSATIKAVLMWGLSLAVIIWMSEPSLKLADLLNTNDSIGSVASKPESLWGYLNPQYFIPTSANSLNGAIEGLPGALASVLRGLNSVTVSGFLTFLGFAAFLALPGILIVLFESTNKYVKSVKTSAVASLIRTPPAYRTTKFFSFILYKKEKTRIYDPIYADFMLEYYEAIKNGQKWRSRWLRFRFYIDVAKAFGLQTLARLVWDMVDIVRKPADGAS